MEEVGCVSAGFLMRVASMRQAGQGRRHIHIRASCKIGHPARRVRRWSGVGSLQLSSMYLRHDQRCAYTAQWVVSLEKPYR